MTDSNSWETRGAFGAGDGTGAGTHSGGARPQTAEIIKTMRDRCPEVAVTVYRDKADYFLTLDHEGGKHLVQRDNKWALVNKDGDVIASGSTRTLGNAVKNACGEILKGKLGTVTNIPD